MTDEINDITLQQPLVVDELKTLKERADSMGLKYHHATGAKKLSALIAAHIAGEGVNEEVQVITPPVPEEKLTVDQIRRRAAAVKRKALNKLVRIRVQNMNTNKKAWPGEILTAANDVTGTIAKYVAFGVPWHVPQFLINIMKEREYATFYLTKDHRGREVKRTRMSKEFAIEILPNLTAKEYTDLSRRQAMAAGVDNY